MAHAFSQDTGIRFQLFHTHNRPQARSPALVDPDDDGDIDIAVANGSGLALLRNDGQADFHQASLQPQLNSTGWGAHDINRVSPDITEHP